MPETRPPYDLNAHFTEYVRQIRELRERFKDVPRLTPGRAQILGWDIEFPNAATAWHALEVQVLARINDFQADHPRPRILDCGANIGISVLNYKRQYPEARITAFEPDPDFLPLLRRNLERNGAADVEIIDAAAWIEPGEARWHSDGIEGSRILLEGEPADSPASVRTVDLADYLGEPIDLLKVDIEGAEYAVIKHLRDRLGHVKNIVVESHVTNRTISAFAGLLETLKSAGFSVVFNTYGPWRDLVRNPPTYNGKENYVLVAGWRGTADFGSPGKAFVPNFPFPLQEQSEAGNAISPAVGRATSPSRGTISSVIRGGRSLAKRLYNTIFRKPS